MDFPDLITHYGRHIVENIGYPEFNVEERQTRRDLAYADGAITLNRRPNAGASMAWYGGTKNRYGSPADLDTNPLIEAMMPLLAEDATLTADDVGYPVVGLTRRAIAMLKAAA